MRIFIAGASGVIGRPLLAQLSEKGHEVTALTRSEAKRSDLEALGARVVIGDALDPGAVTDAVSGASPEVVINQLTDLPQTLDPRKLKRAYEGNNRIRREGTANLLAAAQAAGTRRIVAQSSGFWYAYDGTVAQPESKPMITDFPEPLGEGARVMTEVEQALLESPLEAVILRYGSFYGPGTWISTDGDTVVQVRKRRYPIIGGGTGYTSFIHVEDAASATVAALDAPPGIYNVADDEPVQIREWLPELARALGAKPPRRVPAWLVRPVAGAGAVAWLQNSAGADNTKAKRELAWTPRHPSWREGFRRGLGQGTGI